MGEKIQPIKYLFSVVWSSIQKYSKVNVIDIIVNTVSFKTSPIPIGFKNKGHELHIIGWTCTHILFQNICMFACYSMYKSATTSLRETFRVFVFVIVRTTGCACVDVPVCVDERPFRSKQQGTEDYVIRIHE